MKTQRGSVGSNIERRNTGYIGNNGGCHFAEWFRSVRSSDRRKNYVVSFQLEADISRFLILQ